MATASNVADWTTCPICLDVFDNPKSLPCIHGFCLKCLEGHFHDRSPEDEVPCPLCRKKFKIPPDGLVGLRHHFFIQHLVNAKNVSNKLTDHEVPCEACLEESEVNGGSNIPTATVYCVDCSEKLCEKCSRHHRRPKMKGGPHDVRHLGAELEQELFQLKGNACKNHIDKQVELYCHECKENICVLCFASKHRSHETGEISHVAETFRARMDGDDKQILSGIRTVRQQSEQMKQEVVKFHNTVESLRKKIVEAGEIVKRVVDQQVNDCLEELQSEKVDGDKQVDIIQGQLELALVAMDSFHTYSRELLYKGRPSDITQSANELHERATELLASDATLAQYCPPNIAFIQADIAELAYWSLIGKISPLKSKHETAAGDVGQDVGQWHTVAKGKSIWGVTFLDELLYLLRYKSEVQIEVYDTDSYKFQRYLTVPGIRLITDMIACAHHHCIYISGYISQYVHRVGLRPDASTTQWSVHDMASCLSLTHKHNVLVSCPEVRKVKEFSSKGKLLRQVQLGQDIMSPWHAIQLSNGQLVVCHGNTCDDAIHRVCVVGSNGQVDISYGGLRGYGTQNMNGAFHLAVDSNGYVFVADFKNRRVLLLSPALTYVREVVSSDQLGGKPRRLSIDVQRRLLYVSVSLEGDKWTGGAIVVVNV